jgi:pre-mRNA-splicing factor SYF1
MLCSRSSLTEIRSISLKVYERGIDLFQYPVAFELWNIYLSKFIDRYVSGHL